MTVTFAGSGDAFGSGGRYQACIHLRPRDGAAPVLLDCGATSLPALKRLGLDPGEIAMVVVSHLHGDHFGGLPFLILDGQFSGRRQPLTVAGPPGVAERLATTMECLLPGSSSVHRRFEVSIVELAAGTTVGVDNARVSAWKVDHPSGSPPLALHLQLNGTRIAYTGDTAWTDTLLGVADGADLFIAEAYYRRKPIPFHLRHADLQAHQHELNAARIVLTHMSADMLDHADEVSFDCATDGLVIQLFDPTARVSP